MSGAWLLYFTETTVYWVSKPTVRPELSSGAKRLHCEDYAALESDLANVYFWHGVMVPAFVVTRPDWITIDMIRAEQNQEVRRVMIERMGWDKFCSEAGVIVLSSENLFAQFPALPVAELVSAGERLVTQFRAGTEVAELIEATEFKDFENRPLRFVRVTDPSTGRQYIIRVDHDCPSPYDGIARSFGTSKTHYLERFYLRQGDVCLRPLAAITGKSQHS